MGYSIKDVSFAGTTITISGAAGTVEVRDFMDDANPVEFQDCEVSAVGVNCNGNMIRYAKPSAIMMSVTVIPGSDSDKGLYNMWRAYRIQSSFQSVWEEPISASISYGNRGSGMSRRLTTMKNGTMVSGPAGISSNGEGKMQGRTYTFAFLESA